MIRIGKFNVRIVHAGDKYGLGDCLTHEGGPMIEFYDSRYVNGNYWKRGQFVSRYYVNTLSADFSSGHLRGGLCLEGGVPEWCITFEQLETAVSYALDGN